MGLLPTLVHYGRTSASAHPGGWLPRAGLDHLERKPASGLSNDAIVSLGYSAKDNAAALNLQP